jgi:hypothetical protein
MSFSHFLRLCVPVLAGLVVGGWLVGCAPSKETVVVTNRPAPVPSTEAVPPPPPSIPVVVGLTDLPAGFDTVQARRFDGGKMWTFDNPPLAWFQEAYQFTPDTAWFEKARSAALRFATYCSASFVSPNGLVMTNHHCGRESVSKVSKPGENLLDKGFYAPSLEEERKVEGLFVDQLVALKDITAEVYAALEGVQGDDAQTEARTGKAEALETQMTTAAKAQDSTLYVQVIELYDGGQYAAYTFRRYSDVRLVMIPELQMGYFGGDPDNFTYPRYNLDMSFFRVYDAQGKPYQPAHYFPWSANGSREGEVVFVVGNPGSTSRLSTVSQLLYKRDYELPQSLGVLHSRAALLRQYNEAHPEEAEKYDLRNPYFSLENSIKSMEGQLGGLQTPYLIARRADAERDLMVALAANDSLQRLYGTVFEDLRQVQRSKEATARQAGAFNTFLNPSTTAHTVIRSLYAYVYAILKQRGAPASQLEEIRKEALQAKDWPMEIETAFTAAFLRELQQYLGNSDPSVRRLLGSKSPEMVADSLIRYTALKDSAGFVGLLDKGYLGSQDVTLDFIQAVAPLYFTLGQQLENFEDREANLNARLARAVFAVYGTKNPPDASFSLRLADGVVQRYTYNGTTAPAYTTFFGLYDRYHSFPGRQDWDLPERWRNPPPTFDRSTPFNLVSTNDITGGNSGSPLLNRNLEVVGLVFDGNIESLPNEYVFSDEAGRTISVDSRGILEALDDLYDADRIVLELRQGTLAPTEAEADTMR